MTNYDNEKVYSSLSHFRRKLSVLLDLLERYQTSDFETKKRIYPELIVEFKSFKEDLKREIKILIQYDASLWVSDQLLPSLAVTSAFLQDIGINRINPNSIHKVVQQVRKAYFFMERYDCESNGRD
ncbi:hypothetical protein AB685_01560 [Bacillus sp. LL01]|uniref:hypothetical protein n=1 Tax=Bacillus sp. LL01 TaxID=1665556 RepID=UPI00064D67E7|nr:hypothetical protein [Bacillus sp. LL01]KMJ59589.1 hypothetical protein AB685_01560 [Bacillus sp. LL01]